MFWYNSCGITSMAQKENIHLFIFTLGSLHTIFYFPNTFVFSCIIVTFFLCTELNIRFNGVIIGTYYFIVLIKASLKYLQVCIKFFELTGLERDVPKQRNSFSTLVIPSSKVNTYIMGVIIWKLRCRDILW